MAIKIIKTGTAPDSVVWKGTCFTCKSELEWLRKDAIHHYHKTERDEEFSQVLCPICGQTCNGYRNKEPQPATVVAISMGMGQYMGLDPNNNLIIIDSNNKAVVLGPISKHRIDALKGYLERLKTHAP
jgi:hypothetical protein